ncbi:uncharacterized protein FIBRA_06813 [Fibroporia radiculosa]|uniref:RNA exonuclease 4 n=1 Tax=Fibroporia radiculosa TaxID=599839 RepID=J4H4A0_9APHY|nr:uncharacterized protein FIBRA_06813 [Fibroporia radiculosa]CCM04629.1 predicted protein [Fibroporia radiculosa]
MPSPGKRPSSNWLALQKTLPDTKTGGSSKPARKKRKVEHRHESLSSNEDRQTSVDTSFVRGPEPGDVRSIPDETKNGESIAALRTMILGELQYSLPQQQPGKYLALDCEMVGVGPEGKESSLARVSLVNYYGAVQLDVFVRQRERVTDYRTQFSGVRASDMGKAKQFGEVQAQVAELLKDRILVGHAVHNDMKALLLSHPHHQTRDTQIYAFKHKVTRSKRAALRHLVQQELGLTIQSGEHSSVTDARATMALYRIHRKEWERGQKPHLVAQPVPSPATGNKRKRINAGTDSLQLSELNEESTLLTYPGGGRKGVSSGLSTVVKRRDSGIKKTKWWVQLDGSSKGHMRMAAGS